MPRLILMRHAKSDWGAQGQPDIDRPLNPRGREAATALGRWLSIKDYVPANILCSPATRTRQTWQRAAEALQGAPAPTIVRALYLAETDTILGALRAATGETVLLLAHNPGIADAAMALAGRPPRHSRFADYPTGATLVLDFPGPWPQTRPGTGLVADFVVPADLPGPEYA